ncbi:HBL/NHE enterotoxin family protein [Bacillus thuringiensis]|uniref:HBL/NHE enterotoxin family protein n=1 Tax=Bacillus thuringiensis TaxID=1428 RepID=UPI0011A62802|nr:HBL/NHE enterotoxin family protein [Bacillus thuringiensis]
MKLKVLATTGLALSLGLTSFNSGSISFADTIHPEKQVASDVKSDVKKYRYDKLQKALPGLGATMIALQSKALEIEKQGLLEAPKQKTLQTAHKTLKQGATQFLNTAFPEVQKTNQSVRAFVINFEGLYEYLATNAAKSNDPTAKAAFIKQVKKLQDALESTIKKFGTTKTAVNTSATNLQAAADDLQSEIQSMLTSLSQDDSSMAILANEIQTIQEQMKENLEKIVGAAVNSSINSLEFGVNLGTSVLQLPLDQSGPKPTDQKPTDSSNTGSSLVSGSGQLALTTLSFANTANQDNVIKDANQKIESLRTNLVKKVQSLTKAKLEVTALAFVNGQADSVTDVIAAMDTNLGAYTDGLQELKEAFNQLESIASNTTATSKEITEQLDALKRTVESLKVLTEKQENNYSIQVG